MQGEQEQSSDEEDEDCNEVPQNVTSNSSHWKKRQRSRKVVTRLSYVSPRDSERYCLRLLLLNTPGAKSFEDLRTVDGIIFSSFREACLYKNLLTNRKF